MRQAKHQTEDIQTEAVIQEVVEIMWDSKGYNNGDRFMEIGNVGAHHRQERSWWAKAQAAHKQCNDGASASRTATTNPKRRCQRQ